jgi:hypothetical protein
LRSSGSDEIDRSRHPERCRQCDTSRNCPDWDDERHVLPPEGEQLEKTAMRSLLTVGFLISLTACASAAPIHGAHARHRAVAHHEPVVSLGDFVIPRGAYAGPRPPISYNDTPSYNDPSKFGGQSLGMDP